MQRHVDDWGCSEVRDVLEMSVDGELGEVEAARIEAHLGRCAACRSESWLAEQIVSELRSLPTFDLPDRVARVARGRASVSLWSRLRGEFAGTVLRPLPTVAAIAAVVLTVLVLVPWRGPRQPQVSAQEVERATAEAKLALAYVATATRRAERRVTNTIFDDGIAGWTVGKLRRTIQAVGGGATSPMDSAAAPSKRLSIQGG